MRQLAESVQHATPNSFLVEEPQRPHTANQTTKCNR